MCTDIFVLHTICTAEFFNIYLYLTEMTINKTETKLKMHCYYKNNQPIKKKGKKNITFDLHFSWLKAATQTQNTNFKTFIMSIIRVFIYIYALGRCFVSWKIYTAVMEDIFFPSCMLGIEPMILVLQTPFSPEIQDNTQNKCFSTFV